MKINNAQHAYFGLSITLNVKVLSTPNMSMDAVNRFFANLKSPDGNIMWVRPPPTLPNLGETFLRGFCIEYLIVFLMMIGTRNSSLKPIINHKAAIN